MSSNGVDSISQQLENAILGENVDAVRRVLDDGADARSVNVRGFPVFIHSNVPEITKLLLAYGADVNCRSPDDFTPLHHAALQDDMSNALVLIDAGANLDAVSSTGATPLSWAADRGQAGMIELLAGKGASIELDQPLHAAASKGHIDAIQVLLSLGCGIDARDNSGETALSVAAENKHAPVVSQLLEAGADPNAFDDGGCGPAHRAAIAGSLESLVLLMEAGAELDGAPLEPDEALEDGSCKATVLNAAAMGGSLPVLEMLARSGLVQEASRQEKQLAIVIACRGSKPRGAIEFFARHGARVDLPPPDGWPWPLCEAAILGRTAVATTLLELGADPTVIHEDGKTPETLAIENDHEELASILRSARERMENPP